MKKNLISLFLASLLSSCYSLEINSNENTIHRAVRSFRMGTSNIQSEKLFNKILRSNSASKAQKSYAYMYLAKIYLDRNEIEKAEKFLAQSMQESNIFPYECEILADYFYRSKEYVTSKKYYRLLIGWLDTRIRETDGGIFDVDRLEFMNIRCYIDRKFENKYIKMYDKNENKELRKKIYIMYLMDRKQNALAKINCMYSNLQKKD